MPAVVGLTTNFSNVAIEKAENLQIATGTAYKSTEKEYKGIILVKSTDMLDTKRMRFEGPSALTEQTEDTAADRTFFSEGYIESTSVKLYSYDMPISWHLRKFQTKSAVMIVQMGEFLGRSANLRFEYTGMSPLNNGFSSTAPYAGGDTAAYFSASHAFKSTGEAYINLLTAADCNKTSLESALKTGAALKQENDIPVIWKAEKIVFGADNILKVPELLKSTLDPESGNNTYNAIREFGIKKQFTHFASDADQWTMDSTMPSRALLVADGTKTYKYVDEAKKSIIVGVSNSVGSGHYDQMNSLGNQGT